jgi:tripartite-type tricarboxylate transporter receptor subunit TctC
MHAKIGGRMMLAFALLAIACTWTTRVQAQTPSWSWPQRIVRFIVPSAPGSATDIGARLFADRLTGRWGKSVVIDNRPGDDGLAAIEAFTSASDDHALLFASADTLPYEAQTDLLPVASVSAVVLAVSVPEALKVGSLSELAAVARRQPGLLNAAAAPGLSDFLLSSFLATSGSQMPRIAYRDILQAPNDLAEGRTQLLMSSFADVVPLIPTGRIKVLAVNSRDRAPVAPDVPTAIESGYPAMALEGLNGLFGPGGMADDLRERIAADVIAVAADPVIPARLELIGQNLKLGGPQEFAARIEEQRLILAAIATSLGLRLAPFSLRLAP